MESRDVPNTLDQTLFTEKVCCLLCSEATPEKCHRRLVAERIVRAWPGIAWHGGSTSRIITRSPNSKV